VTVIKNVGRSIWSKSIEAAYSCESN